jgi:hypothetical protein
MTCVREDELLDALDRGYVGDELALHVTSCAACRELHAVAGALLDDRVQTMLEAPVPSSGTMWWRMRVRRHHEAQATARRSLLIGQAATLAIAIALVVAFLGADVTAAVRELAEALRVHTLLLVALAGSVLLAPIAGWMALRQK